MLKVELLKSAIGNVYKFYEDDLIVYIPYFEMTKKVIDKAREENIIGYIERVVSNSTSMNINAFMHGLNDINLNMPSKQVIDFVGEKTVELGKATPEKRRYSMIALPLAGLKGFDVNNGKVPCLRLSCTGKGTDVRVYTKYLQFKEGSMTIIDANEDMTLIKGISMLIKSARGFVLISKY